MLEKAKLIATYVHHGKELELYDVEDKRVQILMTKGLKNHTMRLPEKADFFPNIELFFCLPSYWDLSDESPKFQWPKEWLTKLWEHVVSKDTWLGHGHTVRCFPDYSSISANMKENHLFLVDPILLKDFFEENGDKTTKYLGVVPIFGEEMDFKQAKGTYKLLKKLTQQGHTEKLDDFRESVLKGRLKFFR